MRVLFDWQFLNCIAKSHPQLAMNDDTSTAEIGENGKSYAHLKQILDDERSQPELLITKQTLANSPTILYIYRDFKVRTNKPFKGLSSKLINDAEYQYLTPPEEDSQMDVFDEDDEILDELDTTTYNSTTSLEQLQKEEAPKFELVQLFVKYQSVLVNGVDYKLKSHVRSSCLIRASLAQEEDHILLSLKSGFLILLRVFLVPKQIGDVDFDYQPSLKDKNFLFKPFIVQWWSLQQPHNYPELSTSGYILKSSPSGLSTVSCSASQSFRIYKTLEQSNAGTVLQNHLNIPLNGFLVDCCFIESRSALQSDIFLSLFFTEDRRLYINLFCWFNFYAGDSGISKSTLPLENTFDIPIFIAPLQRNSAYLFVTPKKLTVISVHDIMSGHHEFKSVDFRAGSFPSNYYIPKSQIRSMDHHEVDEVILSSDIGVIYSILVSRNGVESIVPIARASDSITTFTFERVHGGFELIYGSTCGSNKRVLLSNLYEAEYTCDIDNDTKLVHSKAELQKNLDNWAPVVDFQVIPSSQSNKSDELWAITGSSSKTKLTHMKVGFYGVRQGDLYPELRKVVQSWHFKLHTRLILVCAFPFETKLLEYEGLSEEEIVEVEDATISKNEQTIFCCAVNATQLLDANDSDIDYLIQVTTNSVTLTDLASMSTCITDECILFGEIFANCLILIIERGASTLLGTYAFEPVTTADGEALDINLKLVSEMTLEFQPSMLKRCMVRGIEAFAIGAYEGFIRFYQLDEISWSMIEEVVLTESLADPTDFVPHDLIYTSNQIFVGTTGGYLARTSQQISKWDSILRIGSSEVKLYASMDEEYIFIQCRNLYMMNIRSTSNPNPVHFNDLTPKIVNSLVEFTTPTTYPSHKRLGVFRNNGFVMTDITTYTKPVLKQVQIPDETKKLLYLPHISIFILLCGSRRGKLKFVDRMTFRLLEHTEFSSKRLGEEGVLSKNEVPLCACIWLIKRHDRMTHKVLLGCSNTDSERTAGVVKVLNIKRLKSAEFISISVSELSSFDHSGPITHIQQVQNRIFFTDKQKIYFTFYDEAEKRFSPVQFFKAMPSEITSMSVSGGSKILVTTKEDSLFQIDTSSLNNVLACYPKSIPFLSQVNFKDRVFASAENSLVIVMDSCDSTFYPFKGTKIQMSGIARLVSASLSDTQNEYENGNVVLGVTISGEVFAFRLVDIHGKEIKELLADLNKNSAFKLSLTDHLNKLDRPFISKLSGTGLLSLNKPYFDYPENRHDLNAETPEVVDYDLEELSTTMRFNI